jgi:hypothetical protein
MDLSTASGIETEAPPQERAARSAIEIGPYDLPEPSGGWVDLFQDEDEDEGEAGWKHCATPVAAAPRARLDAPAADDGAARATSPSPGRARRWVLLPEALVVAAFVLFGVAFAALVARHRGPAAPAAGSFVSAPVEVKDPAPTAAWRRHARLGMPAPPRVGQEMPVAAQAGDPGTVVPAISSPQNLAAPMAAESPLDPEAPPPPNLTPFGG